LFLLISTIAIIYTGCRGAYLALFALIVAVVAALWAYLKNYSDGFTLIKKRYKMITSVLFVAFATLILSTPAILKRILSIFAARGDSSISFRLNVYQAAIHMFLDNPIFGIGVGNQNFREIYGLYMKTGFDALGSYSVLLEIAVESGIFALIAFCGFLYIAFKKCIEIFKDNCELKDKVLIFSIFLVLVGSMAHGLFDTIFFRPQLQMVFWLNIAILNTYFLKNTQAK
jgi:putative inorganic carbon (HCO3(-)) transporter